VTGVFPSGVRALGLIPARGQSKGIPRKNIVPLAGNSLVERAFASASASGALDRIVLSTESREIAELGRTLGIEVPFLRPPRFAEDSSPMIDVAVHALEALDEEGYRPDVLVLLQPTSPLRRPEHIREALRRLGDHDALCTVVPLPRDLCPHYLMKIDDDGLLRHFMPDGSRYTRRQDVPLAYRRDGTLFVTKAHIILKRRSFYGERCFPMILPEEESLNIDTAEDWKQAEARLAGAEN
jgi:CMP-N-acetylneuraminic acid synthetase